MTERTNEAAVLATGKDYTDPAVREAARREWNRPEKWAEHQEIHGLLDALDRVLPAVPFMCQTHRCGECGGCKANRVQDQLSVYQRLYADQREALDNIAQALIDWHGRIGVQHVLDAFDGLPADLIPESLADLTPPPAHPNPEPPTGDGGREGVGRRG